MDKKVLELCKQRAIAHNDISDIIESDLNNETSSFSQSLSKIELEFQPALERQVNTLREATQECESTKLAECEAKCKSRKQSSEESINSKIQLRKKELDDTKSELKNIEYFIGSYCETPIKLIIIFPIVTVACIALIIFDSLTFISVGIHDYLSIFTSFSLSLISTFLAIILARDYKFRKYPNLSDESEIPNYVPLSKFFYYSFISLAILYSLICSASIAFYTQMAIQFAIYLILHLFYYLFVFLLTSTGYAHHACKHKSRIYRDLQRTILKVENLIENLQMNLREIKAIDCKDFCEECFQTIDHSRENIKTSVIEILNKVNNLISTSHQNFHSLSTKCISVYTTTWLHKPPEGRLKTFSCMNNELTTEFDKYKTVLSSNHNDHRQRVIRSIKSRLVFDEVLVDFLNKIQDQSRNGELGNEEVSNDR